MFDRKSPFCYNSPYKDKYIQIQRNGRNTFIEQLKAYTFRIYPTEKLKEFFSNFERSR